MEREVKKLKGFSLGEVMLAAFVIASGVTASMALIMSSIRYTYDNRDAIIAAELAQEGIELVRNVRDNDLAAGNTGFTGFSNSQRHCSMDFDATALTCSNSQGNPSSRNYNLQLSGGRFRHVSSLQPFKRYLYVNYNNGQNTAQVISYVFWDWPSNTSMPSYIPSNGGTAGCTISNKCVFTEAMLANWLQ